MRERSQLQVPSLKPPRPSDSVSAEDEFPSFPDNTRRASRSGEEQTVILDTPTILLSTVEISPVQSILIAGSDWEHHQGKDTVTGVILEPGPGQCISIYLSIIAPLLDAVITRSPAVRELLLIDTSPEVS